MSFEVEFRNVVGETAAIGSAGQYTLVVDRPADGGGLGLGFNGGQLLYLAIGGCVSNDLFREASARGINLTTVRVLVRGNFTGEPAVSEDVSYEVELGGTRRASSCKSRFRMWTQLPRFRTQCVEARRWKLSSVRIVP